MREARADGGGMIAVMENERWPGMCEGDRSFSSSSQLSLPRPIGSSSPEGSLLI